MQRFQEPVMKFPLPMGHAYQEIDDEETRLGR